MPYDPDDSYTAEPKLLSLDCFPTFFIQPLAPPEYDTVMANNTRYHRLSNDDNRVSMDSAVGNPELDASLLLLDPMRTGSTASLPQQPPKKSYHFTCHPTLLFRLIAVCVLIPSFVLFVVSHRERPRNLSAIILTCFAMVRNILVIIHYITASHFRIKFSIEFRNRGAVLKAGKRNCPEWLKQGLFHVLLDLVLVTLLLITTIIANSGAYQWRRYGNSYSNSYSNYVVPGCVLSYIGSVFYLFSIIDLGRPSSVTTSGGIAFDYSKRKDDVPGQPPLAPQVYRDVEAAGGLGSETRKTGADSPVII